MIAVTHPSATGSSRSVQLLLESGRVDATLNTPARETLLILAVRSGRDELALYLLHTLPDKTLVSITTPHCVHVPFLLLHTNDTHCVFLPVNSLCAVPMQQIGSQDVQGLSAMHHACVGGLRGVAEALLARGVSCDTPSEKLRHTPLMLGRCWDHQ